MEEEDTDISQFIKGIRKIKPKYATAMIIICLFFLFYQLGFIWGYNQAFHSQEDYYEEKMMKYCICQEEPTYRIPTPLKYSVPDEPLEILNTSS